MSRPRKSDALRAQIVAALRHADAAYAEVLRLTAADAQDVAYYSTQRQRVARQIAWYDKVAQTQRKIAALQRQLAAAQKNSVTLSQDSDEESDDELSDE